MENEIKYLKFNFDVSAYRLLGRELITDRITALFELVKNSYDANAQNVTVEFININPRNDKSKIIITDDGIGMSFEDIRDKWMVIGTSSKRRNRLSPPPFYRKVIGNKGVGRFSVDKLGAKLLLKTKKKDSNEFIFLETDSSKYKDLETKQLSFDFSGTEKQSYFTDIENSFWFQQVQDDSQGTRLEITLVDEVWTENDIKRAYKELAKLILPKQKPKFPFNIRIKSQYEDFKDRKVESLAIQFATEEIHLSFDAVNNKQEILKAENGVLKKIQVQPRVCGFIKFSFYYFDVSAKIKFKKHFGDLIDGIIIYRDGLITTPFAENEELQNKRKDILGIDKRRYSGFFDKVSTRDLLGYVELSDELNPDIIETTNRQGFVDNKAWRELNEFIIEQLNQLEIALKQKKDKGKKETKTKLSGASEEIKSFREEIKKVKEHASAPEIKKTLENIEKRAGKLQSSVNKGIKDYQELEKESKQKENLFFSLVSLQTYSAMLSHITRHTIGVTIRDAEYFNKHFPNPQYNDRFKHISEKIYTEMLKLRSGIDFMLKYAKSDAEIEQLNIKELMKEKYNEEIDKVLNTSSIAASILMENRDALVCLGEDIDMNFFTNN